MSTAIESASDLNFEQDILDSDTPILLWFRAKWCGPCRATSSMLESLCDAHEDVRMIAIDVDEQPEIPVNYGVKALPTVFLMEDGEVIERVSGATKRHRFEHLFERASNLD
jgi:thioredoxin 1